VLFTYLDDFGRAVRARFGRRKSGDSPLPAVEPLSSSSHR
jgi:hypothetical protein